MVHDAVGEAGLTGVNLKHSYTYTEHPNQFLWIMRCRGRGPVLAAAI